MRERKHFIVISRLNCCVKHDLGCSELLKLQSRPETDVSISAFPLSQRGTEKEPRAATRAHKLWANVTGLYVT